MRIADRIIEWFPGWFNKPVRFWTEEEWVQYTAKEKLWLKYKEFWMYVSQGNAEVDNILFFIQGQFVTMFIAWGVAMEVYKLPWWTFPVPFAFVIINKSAQYWIGRWKDKKDLIALETEHSNRRNILFRRLHSQLMGQEFRKELMEKEAKLKP